MNNENKKKKNSKKKIFRRLFFISLFVSFITLLLLYLLDILPILYFIVVAIVFFLFDFLIALLTLSKGWKKRFFGTILSTLKMIGMGVIIFYLVNTMDFLHKINGGNYNTENYSVIVLNNSNYNKLKDLEDKKMGIVKLGEDKGLLEAKQYLNKKVSLEYIELGDISDLINSLLNKKVDAILVEDAEKKLLESDSLELISKEKVIFEFSIDIEIDDGLVKNVDITKTPFNVYISGIDSYGKISSVSRSDVNMIVTINPITHKIHLTSIPRDYYVKLNGINTKYKDKLTHAGIHGVDTSIKTIEDLLSIDINYYAKVNFTSLINLVDELGGIDVTLDKAFTAYYNEDGTIVNYTFSKGINHLNGKQALAFARERYSLPLGDIERVHHQQILIEGIINKALSTSTIIKYNDLLSSLEGKFITNIGIDNITKLVKYQIKNNSSWEISTYTLNGTEAHEYTYSYKKLKSYVMIPNNESVIEATGNIKRLLEEI